VLVLALGACSDDGGDDEDSAASTTTEAPASTTSTTIEATTTTAPAATSTTVVPGEPCPAPFAGNSPAEFDDQGGRYLALVMAASLDEMSYNVVQWLVGDDADAAYEAETGDSSGAPNDYFIRDHNPLVRTSPLAESAELWMLDVNSGDVTRPALVDDFGPDVQEFPTWLTFEDGAIVGVCQQYVP
jgi:hypothetical protein